MLTKQDFPLTLEGFRVHDPAWHNQPWCCQISEILDLDSSAILRVKNQNDNLTTGAINQSKSQHKNSN